MLFFIEYIEKIGTILWMPVMLIVLTGSSLILSVKFRFLQIFKVKYIYEETVKTLFNKNKRQKNKTISPFQAVSTALAGTMGVGNIAGVATAIAAGGAGAVFWMWISAFLCMILKYCEVVLAQLYKIPKSKTKNDFIGGPMYYISNGIKSKKLAVLFSVFCIFSSFGIGNISQSNTVAEAVENAFGISKLFTGVFLALITAAVIIGGVRRIFSFTSKLIPVMSIFYMIIAVTVIIFNIENLFDSLKMIFTEAFSLRQVGGGVLGFTISRAVRFGVSRGVFTNEAGLGSASIAHAAADTDSPVKQGMWGIFEVFFDTIVSCTLTALAILTADAHRITGLDGINMTAEAFNTVFGEFSGVFLSVAIMLFAIATLVSWNFYGECCVLYLFKNSVLSVRKKAVNIYKIVFVVLIAAGAAANIKIVWSLSDIFNVLMALPNIIAVFMLRSEVYAETVKYLQKKLKNQ